MSRVINSSRSSFMPLPPCFLCVKNNTKGGDKCQGPGPECPTCEGFICGYCKRPGHTIKHCQVLAENKRQKRSDIKISKQSFTDEEGFSTVASKKRATKAQAQAAAAAAPHIGQRSKYAVLPNVEMTAPEPWETKKVLSGWAAKAASLSSSDEWKDTSTPAPAPPPPPEVDFREEVISSWADYEEVVENRFTPSIWD